VLEGPQGLVGLRDSKRLSPRQRERWSAALRERASAWSLGEASAAEVDGLNVLEATRLAMRRAVQSLGVVPDLLLIDAVRIPALALAQWPIVRGDESSLSIAAASVLAKVHRDRLMSRLDPLYPEYHFARNKGYGTAAHLQALRLRGPCPLHRRSFHGADGRPA
jgi:ribonuclease HII